MFEDVMMVTQDIKRIMVSYVEAYQQLYQRQPSNLHALDREWVIVNGARMRVSDLEKLTHQLLQEHRQLEAKKSAISRLIKWFRG